ncbi:MAG: FtsX-like permease family protein [Candidatus Nanopelagicales bacterium]
MILTLARRGMLAHKRRLVGLISAIALGVAFLTGTLVLGDTMRASFDQVFSSANAGIDAIVQGRVVVTSQTQGAQSAPVPADLVGELEQVDGVRTVQPVIDGLAQIVGSDGKPIGGNGPPTLAGNWITDPSLNPQRVAEGAAPSADDEVVIDAGSAQTGGISVGDTVEILIPQPTRFTVSGLTKYGDQNSLGGTTYVGMTLPAAEKYLATKGELTSIVLQADDGVTPEQLVERVQPVLTADTVVITGEQLTEEQNQQIQSGFLDFFTLFLTVFAIVAVVVSTFSIYNTFSVIAAQKSRESALLRAVGASRRQVLGAVAGESLLIGLLASAVGVALGVAFAAGLLALFKSLGAVLESAGLVVLPAALVTGFVVGIVVTAIAALFPAIRSSRVPPLAALRDVAVESTGRMTARLVLGAVLIIVGLLSLGSLLVSDGGELPRVAVGAVAVFLGFIVFGPVAARPVARALGAPIAALRGVSGRMARANAARNPRRTASTATALMVGVTVVAMFTIFASSMKAAITDSFVGDLDAELTLTTENFSGTGFDPEMIADFKKLPTVAAVSTLDQATALIDGAPTDITVVDVPDIQAVTDLGDRAIQPNEIAIDTETATTLGLTTGDTVKFGLPNGRVIVVDVGTLYEPNNLVRGVVVPRGAYEGETDKPGIYSVFLTLKPGVTVADGQAQAQAVADRYRAGDVQTRDEFADTAAGQIDQLLGIIYALLVLAIIIALMGIANTLSLSVFERTRELGLLRAVGQTRGQLRSMVRWESVIIALFGTIGGIALGIVLGWALFAAVSAAAGFSASLAISVPELLVIAVIGALVGVLAGWRPAARAAKLDVLAAIASE